jgi:hypothetical protein
MKLSSAQRKLRDDTARKQREDDLAALLETPFGRRFMLALLEELEGGEFGARSADSLLRAAVLRDKAVSLERRCAQASPEGYRLLKDEQVRETLAKIQLREAEDTQ